MQPTSAEDDMIKRFTHASVARYMCSCTDVPLRYKYCSATRTWFILAADGASWQARPYPVALANEVVECVEVVLERHRKRIRRARNKADNVVAKNEFWQQLRHLDRVQESVGSRPFCEGVIKFMRARLRADHFQPQA